MRHVAGVSLAKRSASSETFTLVEATAGVNADAAGQCRTLRLVCRWGATGVVDSVAAANAGIGALRVVRLLELVALSVYTVASAERDSIGWRGSRRQWLIAMRRSEWVGRMEAGLGWAGRSWRRGIAAGAVGLSVVGGDGRLLSPGGSGAAKRVNKRASGAGFLAWFGSSEWVEDVSLSLRGIEEISSAIAVLKI